MGRCILTVLACLALGACGQPRDADWYAAHPEEARERLRECQELAVAGKIDIFDDSRQSVDCQNAAQGASRSALRALGF